MSVRVTSSVEDFVAGEFESLGGVCLASGRVHGLQRVVHVLGGSEACQRHLDVRIVVEVRYGHSNNVLLLCNEITLR